MLPTGMTRGRVPSATHRAVRPRRAEFRPLTPHPSPIHSQASSEPVFPVPISLSPPLKSEARSSNPSPRPSIDASAEAQELKRQICFDFTKGMCTRGAACKYSHSVDHIIAVNSEEKGICFDFLKGLCNRGLMCRFSHDLTNLQAPQESGNGRRRFAPICYDFVKNQCTRGDACRYSHDYASILYGPRGAGKQLNVLCVDYTRGRCLRGDACRYLHPAPAAYGGPASLEAVVGALQSQALRANGELAGWPLPGAELDMLQGGGGQHSGHAGMGWQQGPGWPHAAAAAGYPMQPAVPAPGFDPGYDLVMAQLQGLSLAGQEAAPSGRHPQAGLYEAAVLQSMLLQQRFGAAGPEARSGGFQGTAHAAPGAAAFAQGGPCYPPAGGAYPHGPAPCSSAAATFPHDAASGPYGAPSGPHGAAFGPHGAASEPHGAAFYQHAAAGAGHAAALAALRAAAGAAGPGPGERPAPAALQASAKRAAPGPRLPSGASLPSGFLSSTSRGGYTAPQAHRIKQLPRAMEQLLAGEAGEDLSPTIPAGWYDPTPEQRAGASPAPEPAAPDLAPIFTRAAEDGAARSGGATPVDGARSTTQRGGSGDDRAGLELLQSIWAIHGA
uniref:C3H1-type domain-containing protein n=1 Tax=Auxenochlorella protothecoides TaxID=3075 RepID=A0A1D1ZU30_AUXPR